MVCEDDFITRPTLICASLFEKLEYPDACKDKTEMIFSHLFYSSFILVSNLTLPKICNVVFPFILIESIRVLKLEQIGSKWKKLVQT